jgi:hypothetical protein
MDPDEKVARFPLFFDLSSRLFIRWFSVGAHAPAAGGFPDPEGGKPPVALYTFVRLRLGFVGGGLVGFGKAALLGRYTKG